MSAPAPSRRLLAAVLAAAAVFTACTPLNRTGEQPLSPEEIRFRAIEAKLTELTRRTAVVENKDDTALLEELRRLQGQIEQLRFDHDTLERKSAQAQGDVERRVGKLEGAQAAAQAQAQAAAAVAVGAGAPPFAGLPPSPSIAAPPPVSLPNAGSVVQAATTSSKEEEDAYLRAFEFLKAGKYDNAIVGFRGVLDRYPRGSYSDNAWYWLGESQYVKRQYQPAYSAFSALVERFPASPKVPDALFKGGLAQNELGNTEAAKSLWRRVTKDYPQSNAANLARQRLGQSR